MGLLLRDSLYEETTQTQIKILYVYTCMKTDAVPISIPESMKEQHRYYITCGLYTACYIVKYTCTCVYMYIVYTSLDVICQLTLIYCISHIQDVQLSDS